MPGDTAIRELASVAAARGGGDLGVTRILLVLLCACGGAADPGGDGMSLEPDAGDHHTPDAAAADGPQDSATSIALMLAERDRAARLACPCRVESGAFESVDVCVAKTGYDRSLIDCLSAAVVPLDGPELREQLACEAQAAMKRNRCLEAASCEVITTTACNEHALGCPMFDPQVATQLLRTCPGAAVLGRP